MNKQYVSLFKRLLFDRAGLSYRAAKVANADKNT